MNITNIPSITVQTKGLPKMMMPFLIEQSRKNNALQLELDHVKEEIKELKSGLK